MARDESAVGNDRTLRHANGESQSEESNHPGIRRLPREEGTKRDWGKPGLRSPSSMFKPKDKPVPNLAEFEKESGLELMEGSRHPSDGNNRDIGKPEQSKGLKGRDVRNAEQENLGVAKRAAAQRHAKMKLAQH
jgi:hypothetical protein